MKYLICTCIATCFFAAASFAQSITMKPDSVTLLLCKKWIMDYAMMGDTKIGRMPGASDMTYDFKSDKTFSVTSKGPGGKPSSTKGTWKYVPAEKLIELSTVANGKSDLSVISLQSNALIMLANMKDGPPGEQIKIAFKLNQN